MSLLNGWLDTVPGLDNGELIWSLVACIDILNSKGYTQLAQRYQSQLDLMQKNVIMMFYQGEGRVRSVVKIANITSQPSLSNYQLATPCGPCYLDDPYEGELFAWFMDLYGQWKANGYQENERDKIWIFKRKKLQNVVLSTPEGNITVERGWWFSSHEHWKYMMLPYVQVPINRRVLFNGEKARTWNSAMNKYPGMFASVTDVGAVGNYLPPYISACGIQQIAFEPVLYTDVVTPYSSFPTFLSAGPKLGLAWYKLMLDGPAMQGPLGSTESCNVTGTAISPVVTYDSKITTFLSMLGGLQDINAKILQKQGMFGRFYQVVTTEWSRVFPVLYGEDLDFQLPTATIPANYADFSTCTTKPMVALPKF